METLGPKSTTSDYKDCTLVDVSAQSVRWKVWNASVIARLMAENPHGGDSVWGPEITLNPEDNGADQCQGISVKSAAPGSPAVVQLITVSPGDPNPSSGVQLAGTLTPSGSFSPPVSATAAARIRRNPAGLGHLAVPNAVLTQVTFDVVDFDTNGIVNLAAHSSRLTCQTAGVYMIAAGGVWASAAGGTARQMQVLLNGLTEIAADQRPPLTGGSRPMGACDTHYQLAAGDYLELWVTQDSGGPLNFEANASWSPVLAMTLIA